jgi:prepilin-type N-terminal cleavage/methylation domain-containing protein
MRSRSVKGGFTLIELLVVIAIIAILASILFPVFSRAREQARRTQCLSNVRQLSTAIQMYLQDNSSRFPSKMWLSEIETYVGSRKMFYCPSDSAKDEEEPVCYGYAGTMLRPDGSGINEGEIPTPTEVGVLADAGPSMPWAEALAAGTTGGGMILNGGGLDINLRVAPAFRHGRVVVIGYADGHAGVSPFAGKKVEERKLSDKYSRAFNQALAMGFNTNYAGGIEVNDLGATIPSTTSVTLGGDSAGQQILMAAASIWKKSGGKWYTRGFNGWTADTTHTGSNFVWINATGTASTTVGSNASCISTRIADDAMVVIVNRNTRIPLKAWASTAPADVAEFTKIGSNYYVSDAFIQTKFGTGTGYTANNYQVYSFRPESGSALFFRKAMSVGLASYDPADPLTWFVIPAGDASMVEYVADDAEMVEKVANDPYGIGYCSAAVADSIKVKVCMIGTTAPTTGTRTIQRFPNPRKDKADNYQDNYPETTPAAGTTAAHYKLMRPIYAVSEGVGDTLVTSLLGHGKAISAGPMFKASFWAPPAP